MAVAVVSWNTRTLLSRCLASLEHDAAAGRAEVWVVDNASSDGSPELVRNEFPWVKLIASEQNLGFGAAVNLVAARTDSTWVAPSNADVRVSDGALTALLESGARHLEAGALAPQLILPDGSTQHSVFPFPSVPFTLAYLTGITRMSPRIARRWCIDGGFDPATERRVPWAVGAFLLVRRDAWDEIGGFDRQQWMYAEDLDLGWRLARAGRSTWYVPSAAVFHDESAATTLAWGGERYARWHASTYRWLARRKGAAYARLLAALNVGGFQARAAFLLAQSVAGRAGAGESRRRALDAAHAHAVGLRPRRLEHVR